MPNHYGYVLLESEKWWKKRCIQSKAGRTEQVFVRRGKVGPVKTEQLFFYIKHPVREFRGKAEFVERKTGNPDQLWNEFGIETVFELYNDYREFVKGREDVTFIRLRNLRELTLPVSAKTFLEKTSGGCMLPRGGRYISKELAGMFL